mmetsp:Transcript_37290/g.125951  ORF Transcript_37290/g.125951 Transcript_37290/m.125951 type:complete len:80 (-) Transcript_37290:1102-1341(-)
MEGCASPESTRPGLVGTDHLSVPIPLAGGTLDDVIYPENHLRCFGGGNKDVQFGLERLTNSTFSHISDAAVDHIEPCRG